MGTLCLTVLAALALGLTTAQQVGTLTTENQPSLSVQECTTAGGCTTQQKSVTIDANWRWTHQTGQPKNCYTGNTWDATLCPDPKTCAQNCAIEGADKEYASTYGVHAAGNSLQLDFVTRGQYSTNIGSRVYLMDSESSYKMFKLKNREFTFDVDVSNLPCGLNGALYFVQMDADGGMSKYPGNKAGAKYGTGYCDAQCPHDLKFINGEGNMLNWKPSPTDPNSGTGQYGTCCTEFDVWEANTMGMAYTAHACNVTSQTRCDGIQCGDNPDHRFDGVCDKNGCDFQTFRLNDKGFWGKGSGFVLDTTQKMTVVTQFITADGTDSGPLSEVRRYYTQNGKTIQTPTLKVGQSQHNSISTDYCKAEVAEFADGTNFLEKGGMEATGAAMEKGMVLALSLWDDHSANMLWLDSTYPTGSTKPGAARGTCAATSGVPKDVEGQHPDAHVVYSNIRFGDINSTVPSGPSPPPSPPAPPAPPTPPSPPTPPPPSGCPGGSLSACMNLCPSNPPAAYKACVQECVQRCS